jgi:hypothetical protein
LRRQRSFSLQIELRQPRYSILELRGLGKELWHGVDSTARGKAE